MITPEQLALEVAQNKKRLKQMLTEAKQLLTNEKRKLFQSPTFDFEQKCLVSTCGNYKLQWKLRHRPDLPISYSNQQTNRGIVVFQGVNKKVA